jgi:hypothetical protein
MGLLMRSKSQPELNMVDPTFNAMYNNAGTDFMGEEDITGTETPTDTPSIDVAQLYQEWAAANPNADPAAAFAAGMDAALGKKSPVGMGMMDDFSQMPGMQPDVLSEVDTFGEVSPTPEPQGEFQGAINGGSWRDTVIDITDVGPPSGA